MRRFLLLSALTLTAAITPIAFAQTSASAPDATAIAQSHLEGAGGDPFEEYLGNDETNAAIPTPRSILGYPIGGQFSRHSDVLGYLRTLGGASDRIRIETYGQSHERRDLVVCTVSSPANLARLDEILASNTALADPSTRSKSDVSGAIANNPAIVWFSFNVHGNEPSSTETAMQLAYTLAASDDPRVRAILEDVVIVIDPCLNPDGRERYVSWIHGVTGANPNSNTEAAEHFEPWPQGRTNHYYFDLNRDWLWGVQPESRARLEIYKRYLPHLHIDFHEQGYQSPYFFGLGEKPFNKNIPQETIDWVGRFGGANAAAFDERGLVYATKERFDYLYPGYGKVLPTYHGAVGMLCEKGGHSRAGLAIDFSEEHVLTLHERVAHHFIVAMSDLQYAMENRRENTERFARYFTLPADKDAYAPVTYAIRKDNDPALLEKLADLCAMHDIEIHEASRGARATGFLDYRTGEAAETPPDLDDCWLIPGDQPRGALVRAVFERSTIVEESETYDITGWSLPIAWGLEAWHIERDLKTARISLDALGRPAQGSSSGGVATIVSADQHNFPRAVGAVMRDDLFARIAGAPFTIDGESFPAGSLILHNIRNVGAESLDRFRDECLALGVAIDNTDRGVTDEGHVLGANDNARFINPSIALLRHRPTSAYSFGQLWHLLDLESRIPHTAINTRSLRRADLDAYNVIVVPHLNGSLTDAIGEQSAAELKEWINDGGTLVAIGSASDWAAKQFLGEPDDKPDEEDEDGDEDPEDRDLTWSQRKARNVNRNIPGAMLAAGVDIDHPLCAGVRDWVGVIKRGDRVAPLRANGRVIARFAEENTVIGGVISGEKAEEIAGKAFATQHRVGSGSVVCFSDDITIRGFAHAPVRLILNAITLGPSVN